MLLDSIFPFTFFTFCCVIYQDWTLMSISIDTLIKIHECWVDFSPLRIFGVFREMAQQCLMKIQRNGSLAEEWLPLLLLYYVGLSKGTCSTLINISTPLTCLWTQTQPYHTSLLCWMWLMSRALLKRTPCWWHLATQTHLSRSLCPSASCSAKEQALLGFREFTAV